MKINEIYLSVEGEGIEQGNPTIFIRTYGCNNQCSYCDSKFSTEGNEYKEIPIHEILKEIEKYKPYYYVCITGGEPTLDPDYKLLIDILTQHGYKVWLETNGTTDLYYPVQNNRCSIVMDIKCPSSKMENNTFWKNVKWLRAQDQIKFVIATMEDYKWAKGIVQVLSYTVPAQILFSPVLFPIEAEIKPNQLVELILKDKLFVRFSLQIHKFVWDPNKRGV